MANIAYKGYRMARQLREIVNSEKHVYDVTDTTAVSSTYELIRLSGMGQGDDIATRTGRSILAKSLQIRSRWTVNASATTPTQIRIIVGIDNDANATAPTDAELLSDTTNFLTSNRQLQTDRGRFKILVDRNFTMDPITGGGKNSFFFNKFIRLGNHHIYYDGTSTSLDAKGKLFWFAVSNQATNTPAKVLSCRLRFYDN